MQRFLLLFVVLFGMTATTFAQNDPAAKAILDKLKTRYQTFTSTDVDFTLILEFPEEPKEEQRGHLKQMGEKFRLDLPQQSIISNNETVWLYLKNNQEVQINKAEFDEEEMEGFMSPQDMVTMYESGKFAYALTNEMPEDGRIVQQIEFKPLDRDSEYAKMRLTLDKKSGDVLRMKVFSRDNSRYTFRIDNLRTNVAFTAKDFEWQTSECPECYVEDLRID